MSVENMDIDPSQTSGVGGEILQVLGTSRRRPLQRLRASTDYVHKS